VGKNAIDEHFMRRFGLQTVAGHVLSCPHGRDVPHNCHSSVCCYELIATTEVTCRNPAAIDPEELIWRYPELPASCNYAKQE
jgi:hypothetical protein